VQVDTVAPLVANETCALTPSDLDEAELREQLQRCGVPRIDIGFDGLEAMHAESPFEHGTQGFLRKSTAPGAWVKDETDLRKPEEAGLADDVALMLDDEVLTFPRKDIDHALQPFARLLDVAMWRR